MDRKLAPTPTPSAASEAAVAANGKGKNKGEGKGKDNVQRTCIKIRENRLMAELWRCESQEYKGSHSPICASTRNVGRRFPERLAARAKRAPVAKTKAPRHKQPSRPDGASRSSGDARGDHEPAGGGAWREVWAAGMWNDGSSSGLWEEWVWVPSAAPSSRWTGADQADRTQTRSSGEWQGWRGSNGWGGWAANHQRLFGPPAWPIGEAAWIAKRKGNKVLLL